MPGKAGRALARLLGGKPDSSSARSSSAPTTATSRPKAREASSEMSPKTPRGVRSIPGAMRRTPAQASPDQALVGGSWGSTRTVASGPCIVRANASSTPRMTRSPAWRSSKDRFTLPSAPGTSTSRPSLRCSTVAVVAPPTVCAKVCASSKRRTLPGGADRAFWFASRHPRSPARTLGRKVGSPPRRSSSTPTIPSPAGTNNSPRFGLVKLKVTVSSKPMPVSAAPSSRSARRPGWGGRTSTLTFSPTGILW